MPQVCVVFQLGDCLAVLCSFDIWNLGPSFIPSHHSSAEWIAISFLRPVNLPHLKFTVPYSFTMGPVSYDPRLKTIEITLEKTDIEPSTDDGKTSLVIFLN